MQSREFSIVVDLSDKYYTVFEYLKKIFNRPSCSHIESYRVCQMKHSHSYYQQIHYKKSFKTLVCQMKHSHSYYQQIPHTKYFKRQKQPFANDLKIDNLNYFAIFTEKHLFWSLFLITLQALRSTTLLERDSITCVFLRRILPNF